MFVKRFDDWLNTWCLHSLVEETEDPLPTPIDKAPDPIRIPTPPPINMAVISFSLMEANTMNVLIETIDDESEIDISALGTKELSIRANTVGDTSVGSVIFELNGNNKYKLENMPPYSIAGDNNTGPKPWSYEKGDENTLKATPYTKRFGRGTAGAYREIRFTIVEAPPVTEAPPKATLPPQATTPPITTAPPPEATAPPPEATAPPTPTAAVVSFSLIDANSNQVILETIPDNATIDVSQLGVTAVNIRANTIGDAISSVRFKLNRKNNYRTEKVAPYALAGDISGHYLAWKYSPGRAYTVEATPFSASGGTRNAGTSKQIYFKIL